MVSPTHVFEPFASSLAPNHTNTLSIVDRLPVEIISKIFLIICEESLSESEGPVHTPIFLSSVCRLWRDVALSTQQMWQHLDPASDREGLPLTHLYLERTSSCDLYVQLRYTKHQMPTAGQREEPVIEEHITYERMRVAEALDLLSPHVGRWRGVSLAVRFIESVTGFRELLSIQSASRLTSLEASCDNLGVDPDGPDVAFPEVMFFAGSTPLLKTLVLQGVQPRIVAQPGILKVLPMLTSISLTDLPNLSCADLARLLSHSIVEDLELEDIGIPEPEVTPTPIILPSLKDLSILHPDYPEDTVPLLRLIRAPHLDRLALSGPRWASDVDNVEIINALVDLSTSYASITTLVIHWSSSVHPEADDWGRLLTQYHHIQRLRVHDSPLSTRNLLTALCRVSYRRLQLPSLNHLDVLISSFDDILAFLENLGALPRRVRKLHLTLHGVDSTDSQMRSKCLELLGDWGCLDSGYIR